MKTGTDITPTRLHLALWLGFLLLAGCAGPAPTATTAAPPIGAATATPSRSVPTAMPAGVTATPTGARPAATLPRAEPTPPAASRPAQAAPPSPSPAVAAPPEGDTIPDVRLVAAFPDLPAGSFGSRPLYFAEAPDGTRNAVVLDQAGRVFLANLDEPDRTPSVFLDISDRVSTAGNEEGLLGLAFDPDFASSRLFYVYYSAANPRRSILSRFMTTADRNEADPGSEEVLLEVPQPFANHNGGVLQFGPDGFLYVGLGDGGSGGDPHGHGQNLATLLGSILRIDVRHGAGPGRAYRIPEGNPFTGRPESEARHEIWAYGLRNPWRFSFDRETGDLWAGDVGQNAWEEIDLIVRGGNYGWNVMEGAHCFQATTCDQTGLIPPVAEYSTREFGCAVTGGYVYRGNANPRLKGVYLYADFCSGLIWGLRAARGSTTGSEVQGGVRLVAGPRIAGDTGMLISSFGEDMNGEVYVTTFGGAGGGAGVYRIDLR